MKEIKIKGKGRDGREGGWKERKLRKRRSIGEMIYGRK